MLDYIDNMSKFMFDQLSSESLQSLKNGGVGVIPTDTVYGIVTQVNNPESVKRLYLLKSRDCNPGTIIASNKKQIADMGVAPRYVKMASVFWPNPISVVVPVGDSLSYIHLGKKSLAFRIVADPEIARLLDITGPLLTSSANHPGQKVADTINEARDYFGNLVDFYIDGGDLSGALASTIMKIDETGVQMLRKGSVVIENK